MAEKVFLALQGEKIDHIAVEDKQHPFVIPDSLTQLGNHMGKGLVHVKEPVAVVPAKVQVGDNKNMIIFGIMGLHGRLHHVRVKA